MMDTETLMEKVNALMDLGELDEDEEAPKTGADKTAFFTARPPPQRSAAGVLSAVYSA